MHFPTLFFQTKDTLLVEFIYKFVKKVIQYFCFLDRPIKGGTSLISRIGRILGKGGADLEKWGIIHLTNGEVE